jgi:ABC-type Fe3+/spermidine/putrescine transport system ATPase subunit
MSRLVLSNLGKSFGSFRAVEDVNLSLGEGEFLSLLGPSGCGKTTTLRMIAGFMAPSEGEIRLDGEVISSAGAVLPPEKRGMAMIFQSYAIWPNMTVAQNVGFGLKMQRRPAEESRRRVERILDIVKLGHLADRYPNELSGGQQQRVALARAIVVQPKVLLLDEPLSNLDANLREEMREEIRRLHDEFRITTVYVTHDQAEAMSISDRIAVVNHGRVEQVDEPYALYARPYTRFAAEFIGRTNLLEGRRKNGSVHFACFSAPADGMGDMPDGAQVSVSLRPQNVRLVDAPPEAGHCVVVEGRVTRRCYLGESWDYTVSVGSGALELRAATPATEVHEVDAPVWLCIDPAHIVPVAAAKTGAAA